MAELATLEEAWEAAWATRAGDPGLGLVPCDACERPVAHRWSSSGAPLGYYQVHFAADSDIRPCPRSWPTRPAR